MKKLLRSFLPLIIAVLSLLILTIFLRSYLYINSTQLLHEFKNQNYKEIYSLDTFKLTSRLNSLSSAINWVCIEGKIDGKPFFVRSKGECSSGFFQQKNILLIAEANNIEIIFVTRLPKEVEYLFLLFTTLQSILIFVLIIATRVSEKEKNRSALRVSKLARQMSHDIRSPLALLNTLISETNGISSDDRILINRGISRINDISNNLLLGSKTFLSNDTQPHLKSSQSNIQINSLLAEIVKEKQLEYKKQSHFLITFVNSDIIQTVSINEIEFRRVISNLINNSIEAINKPILTITLSLSREENYAVVKLEDNGKGIPTKILQTLGHKEITTKEAGNGLGVTYAQECVISWNGILEINSLENISTSILIKLPIIKNESTKVVLVDDDELVRLTWKSSAKKNKIDLLALSTPTELENLLDNLSKESQFFIDSQLGNNIKGEDVALRLHLMGFTEIFITSGYEAEHFKSLTFLKGIRDKSPPW